MCGLENCENVSLGNCRVTYLNIDAACRGTVLRNLEVVKSLTDLAPDTQSIGWIKQRSGPYAPMDTKAPDRTNLFPTLFARWRADRPDGWDVNSNVWAKCGAGLSDTTAHIAPYSAKFTTNGAMCVSNYPLASTLVNQLKGHMINFSAWGNIPTGQSFTSWPMISSP